MPTTSQSIRNSLNKAYLKRKITRWEIDTFKLNLGKLLANVSDGESEEFHKRLIATFLEDTWYKDRHFINTRDRADLVIHNGPKSSSSVGVLIEVKSPRNRAEMPTAQNLNVKATQELLLYYLRERTSGNTQLRHLVVTNLHEWFIFDASEFERIIAENKNLQNEFRDFEERRLANEKTDFFYRNIAAPALANTDLQFVYFDLRVYTKVPLVKGDLGGFTEDNASPESTSDALRIKSPQPPFRKGDLDSRLALLYKVLSPPHLLKQPFVNDSNTLDKQFYDELLHIIGLTEVKVRGQKLIQRLPAGSRHDASLLENTIATLQRDYKLSSLKNRYEYGENEEVQLFNVALELVITWINRILFLKLLEAQLVNYHRGNRDYAFLDIADIPSLHILNGLFFQILALPPSKRSGELAQQFAKVPYLNSSLFEVSELEIETLTVSALDGAKVLSLSRSTVLKDNNGKRRHGDLPTLQYLFAFLGAYDFGSEGGGEIQEQNKTLIGASVLGLIFEKINGYKEGSFFTPGFITTFMCRQTLERAVLNKFNEARKCDLPEFTNLVEIHNAIGRGRDFTIEEANAVVNSLKICDPAVGSGHFLVSALNELIAIKAQLGILADNEGKLLHNYSVTVENDELIVLDRDGELFEYHPENAEAQRVQETLFREKQTIIESCLFGGDINANSVKICRLRLWIELLKSAFYRRRSLSGAEVSDGTSTPLSDRKSTFGADGRQLETLPNIDINIKHGDSLISRFGLQADVGNAMSGGKCNVDGYLLAVKTYHGARTREDKQKLRDLLSSIKTDFRQHTSPGGPQQMKLAQLRIKFAEMTAGRLFDLSATDQKGDAKKAQKLKLEIEKLQAEIDDIRNNVLFENATEWRYEFPEVLDAQGNFTGFDVVIGNPPYIRQEELTAHKKYFQANYPETYAGTADLYVYFYARSMQLLKDGGVFAFITSNKWMRANYGKALRKHLIKVSEISDIIDFGELPVFDSAATFPMIIIAQRTDSPDLGRCVFTQVKSLDFPSIDIAALVAEDGSKLPASAFRSDEWILSDANRAALLDKMRAAGKPLGQYINNQIFRGVLTGFNEAFIIDDEKRNELIRADERSAEIIKPMAKGDDVRKWKLRDKDRWIIFTQRGIDIEKYPAIRNHLTFWKDRLTAGIEGGRKPGTYEWYEIQDTVAYDDAFEKPKIIFPDIAKESRFAFDTNGTFVLNTSYMIPIDDKYLLGILNSKAIWHYAKEVCAVLGDEQKGGRLRFFTQSVIAFPIPTPTAAQKVLLEDLVQKVLSAKAANPQTDTSDWETEIDALVYEFYGLTAEEIEVVEEVV